MRTSRKLSLSKRTCPMRTLISRSRSEWQGRCPSRNPQSHESRILWQAVAGIEHRDFVREGGAPAPQDEIDISGGRPANEARRQQTRRAVGNEFLREAPRRRLPAGRRFREPRARQLVLANACGSALLFAAEIDHILAVNFVCAEHVWLEFVSEALRRLLDRRHWVEGQIERRRPFRIEPASMYGRAVAGQGLERPARIMGPISQAQKFQAKPPSAIESR